MTVEPVEHGTGQGAEYSLLCRACQRLMWVPATAAEFECESCRCRSFFLWCSHCGGANVVTASGRRRPGVWRCDWCLFENRRGALVGGDRPATAADAWAALDYHALTHGDPEMRVLGGFQLIGGHGSCPPVGALCSVGALAEGVLVVAEGGIGRSVFPYHHLLALDFGGRGIVQRDAGWVGGGHGIVGALKGMAIASAVNRATRTTEVDTYLRLSSADTEMLFCHLSMPPALVRVILGRIFTRFMAAAQQRMMPPPAPAMQTPPPLPAPPPAPPSAIDELERLTKLHAAGTLTDTEFEAARARQIRRLHAEP